MYTGNQSREQTAARWLVKRCLSDGYTLSVHDGEEWACIRSTDFAAVWDALGNTGSDILRLRKGGEHVGSFSLVWGNAPDASELIADYTDDSEGVMNALWKAYRGKFPG
jgi:hypothetical protein